VRASADHDRSAPQNGDLPASTSILTTSTRAMPNVSSSPSNVRASTSIVSCEARLPFSNECRPPLKSVCRGRPRGAKPCVRSMASAISMTSTLRAALRPMLLRRQLALTGSGSRRHPPPRAHDRGRRQHENPLAAPMSTNVMPGASTASLARCFSCS
jgi:hypothetical protein